MIRQFLRLSGLTLICILMLSAIVYKAALNERFLQQVHQQDQECALRFELGKQSNCGIQLATITGITTGRFTSVFGPLTPVGVINDPNLSEYTHTFRDVPGQRTYYLRFDDGLLQKYFSVYRDADIQTAINPQTPAFELSEFLRELVLYPCIVLWVLLLILGLTNESVKARIITLPLILAIICFLCIALCPIYANRFCETAWLVILALTTVMIVISLLYSSLVTRR